MNLSTLVSNLKTLDQLCDSYTAGKVYTTRDKTNTVLGYLRSLNPTYSSDSIYSNWALSAGIVDSSFVNYVKSNNIYTHSMLNAVFSQYPPDYVTDPSGYRIDIAHLIATADVYFSNTLIPESWGGWAGDLATAMKNTTNIVNSENVSEYVAAYRVIGNESYSCGLTDLRADADAISISNLLDSGKRLWEAVESYYISSYRSRFTTLINSIGSESTLSQDVRAVMTSLSATTSVTVLGKTFTGILVGLAGNPSQEVITACCSTFASYIIGRINNP